MEQRVVKDFNKQIWDVEKIIEQLQRQAENKTEMNWRPTGEINSCKQEATEHGKLTFMSQRYTESKRSNWRKS